MQGQKQRAKALILFGVHPGTIRPDTIRQFNHYFSNVKACELQQLNCNHCGSGDMLRRFGKFAFILL